MNKLLGAIVLMLGMTSAAVTGGAVDQHITYRAKYNNSSYLVQISTMNEDELDELCQNIVDDSIESPLKNQLIDSCRSVIGDSDDTDTANELIDIIGSKSQEHDHTSGDDDLTKSI